MDAVALPKKVMVEFGNCRKCQKCTDFTQIHPFLALLKTALRSVTSCISILEINISSLKESDLTIIGPCTFKMNARRC